jgi:hypothetical protein
LRISECWRDITGDDITDDLEVIPSIVIYTCKCDLPDGTPGGCSARLVALGNVQLRYERPPFSVLPFFMRLLVRCLSVLLLRGVILGNVTF